MNAPNADARRVLAAGRSVIRDLWDHASGARSSSGCTIGARGRSGWALRPRTGSAALVSTPRIFVVGQCPDGGRTCARVNK